MQFGAHLKNLGFVLPQLWSAFSQFPAVFHATYIVLLDSALKALYNGTTHDPIGQGPGVAS